MSAVGDGLVEASYTADGRAGAAEHTAVAEHVAADERTMPM